MTSLTFAYYCSGHGYGHATRVSAVASHLRQAQDSPAVHIVSSAPKHVFEQAISHGSSYRYAEIDPVIVQPLAYHVDRKKSVEVLKTFLDQEDQKLEEEVAWLRDNGVDCVLSDAAYLPCKAANMAGIPSVLVSNFTFDSVYSYLSITFPKSSDPPSFHEERDSLLAEDEPISSRLLTPLVNRLLQGYRCAQLLVRLPGDIPIPSFSTQPSLPSYLWTDAALNTFLPGVKRSLSPDVASLRLRPSVPFPDSTGKRKRLPRRVIQSPLIVRHPSADAYTPEGRERILKSVGIPACQRGPEMKVLIVSFGGQTFRKPNSRASSRNHSPSSTPSQSTAVSRTASTESTISCQSAVRNCINQDPKQIATESHILVPGAPPAKKAPTTNGRNHVPVSEEMLNESMKTINGLHSAVGLSPPDFRFSDYDPQFLPDSSWIAIVCGATAKKGSDDSADDELPDNFFLAPRDVYMPDLTAVADVLLGKLGYGTVSECVDASTPFVFVSRPLFVEEHGLRALLEREGSGLELSREKYEDGDWAEHVASAYEAGLEAKSRRRAKGNDGTREKECAQLATEIIDWVHEWKRADTSEVIPSRQIEVAVSENASELGRHLLSCSALSSECMSISTPPASPIFIKG